MSQPTDIRALSSPLVCLHQELGMQDMIVLHQQQ